MTNKKTSILDLLKKKKDAVPITMVTAYDYPSALLADRADIDVLLVGDTLGMVVLGMESTVPVTMEEMLHHARAVARGAKSAFLIGDMPFMSYQADTVEAVRNASRFLKEANMDAVKLEGGREVANTIRAIVSAGIPVMGHIGLTPQSSTKLGGYRVQGKSAEDAHRLLTDAGELEQAGCFAIVLEAVPAPVAEVIGKQIDIPTIGIGAGPGCDGQVLVYHDLIGLFDRFTPKFVKRYASIAQTIEEALRSFRDEVRDRQFPEMKHSYSMDDEELDEFLRLSGSDRD